MKLRKHKLRKPMKSIKRSVSSIGLIVEQTTLGVVDVIDSSRVELDSWNQFALSRNSKAAFKVQKQNLKIQKKLMELQTQTESA